MMSDIPPNRAASYYRACFTARQVYQPPRSLTLKQKNSVRVQISARPSEVARFWDTKLETVWCDAIP